MGVADHRVGDAAHKSPACPPKAPAPHDYQANIQLLGQVYNDPVSVFFYHPNVGLRDLSPVSSIFFT